MARIEVVEAADAARRARAFAIRRRVFVDEQSIPLSLEFDRHDDAALHLLALVAGRPIGTLRSRRTGAREVKIERVAVLGEARGSGAGRALLLEALRRARAAGMGEAHLHAQVSAAGFYQRLGFVAGGTPFLEDGIPHVRMIRRLGAPEEDHG